MIKATSNNINKITQLVLEQLEDENGRGEFDSETNVRDAFTFVIDWLEEKQKQKEVIE